MKSNILKKGITIFSEGDVGNEMYIIKSGRVEIVKKINDEEVVLATLDPPSFFGEMALFGNNQRSATVRTTADTEIAEINKAYLDLQLRRVPDWFVAILRTLVLRLIDTNKRLKSRYSISLEYSLLKLFLLVVKIKGKREEGGYLADFKDTCYLIESTLSVSHNEVLEKLKDFSFIQMIKFSEEKNEIFVPDEDKLNKFLLFMQGKQDKKTRMTHAFENLSKDDQKMQYFEKIFRLLSRRKSNNDGN